MENTGFKITKFKNANDVYWLKNIYTALVDKYFADITLDDFEYEIDQDIMNSQGQILGKIVDVFENENTSWAKIQLNKRVNFNTLLQLGIPIENIIFDCHHWDYNKGLDGENEQIIIS